MTKNKNAKLIFLASVAIFFPLTIITWISFVEILNIPVLILAICCTIIFFFSWFMCWVLNNNYKLKYLVCKKNLNIQMEKSLSKFNTTNPEFLKVFKSHSKKIYKHTGKIYNFINIPVFKNCDDEKKENSIKVYETLLYCVKNKLGLEGFFSAIEYYNLTTNQKYFCVFNDLISNEMLYFFTELYKLTLFTFHDNELCEEFTKINEKNKEIVKTVYDSILYNFEQEIEQVLKQMIKHTN